MTQKQQSKTADITAGLRAVHFCYDHPLIFEDPYALQLTSNFWRFLIQHRILYNLVLRDLFSHFRPVLAENMARHRYAEDELKKLLIATDLTQLVIVGAGFDSFVLRHQDLGPSLQVYELDHPRTQEVKQQRLQSIIPQWPCLPTSHNLTFIAIDLEKETIVDALYRSTFRPDQKAFFIWLGVTYYLTHQSVLKNLAAIASFATPGSRIIIDYLIPEEQLTPKDVDPADLAWLQKLKRYVARRGEPMITAFNPERLGLDMGEIGLELVENLSPEAQVVRYFKDRTDGLSPPACFHFAQLSVR